MRRAFTLIEMIFTMIIVGLVFMVVPKIIFVTNKSFETVMKEDALFNAISLMGIVSSLPWDDNNTRYDAILATDSLQAAYLCDASTGYYRIGGFKGGRSCIENGATAGATPIGREGSLYNDIDDYDGYSVLTSTPAGPKYEINVTVRYLQDPAPGGSVDLSALSAAAGRSNIKEVNVTVTNASSNTRSRFRSSIYYHSANIGQTYIHKRAWR
ncbi:type II secretion system protein [Hydrogenimonas sp.]